MTAGDVRMISLAEAQHLRHRFLRPDDPIEAVIYDGDDHPQSVHFGAFVQGRLIGVMSAFPRPFAPDPAPDDWQLRGLAIVPEFRRAGHATQLLRAGIAHVHSHNGLRAWSFVRLAIVPLLRSLGFQEVPGDVVVDPKTGPHHLMWLDLRS